MIAVWMANDAKPTPSNRLRLVVRLDSRSVKITDHLRCEGCQPSCCLIRGGESWDGVPRASVSKNVQTPPKVAPARSGVCQRATPARHSGGLDGEPSPPQNMRVEM